MAQGPYKADVIVVGAGIAGASLAARLAGRARVLILEMEQHPGYHATGRSAATYEPTYGPPVIRALTAASGEFFRSPPDGFAEVPLLTPRGVMKVGDQDDGTLAEEEIGLGFHRLTNAEATERLPLLRQGLAHVLIDESTMDIDVELLLRGFLGQHRRAGGQLLTNSRLEAAKRAGGI
jgi:D-arginine dehydrogenase